MIMNAWDKDFKHLERHDSSGQRSRTWAFLQKLLPGEYVTVDDAAGKRSYSGRAA